MSEIKYAFDSPYGRLEIRPVELQGYPPKQIWNLYIADECWTTSEMPEELAYGAVACLNTTGLYSPLRGDEIPRSLDGWKMVPIGADDA